MTDRMTLPPDVEALKPCPFCGGEAEIERLGNARQSTIYSCTECGCSLETGEEWSHGRRWNDRAQTTSPAEKDAEIARYREALGLALEYWSHRQQRYKNRHPVWVQKALAALGAST